MRVSSYETAEKALQVLEAPGLEEGLLEMGQYLLEIADIDLEKPLEKARRVVEIALFHRLHARQIERRYRILVLPARTVEIAFRLVAPAVPYQPVGDAREISGAFPVTVRPVYLSEVLER